MDFPDPYFAPKTHVRVGCITAMRELYFCGRTLMTNHHSLAVLVVCPLGAVNQQFYAGPDRFVIRNVFLCVF